MRNVRALEQRLQLLGLTNDESAIFMNLLHAPKTQLQVSRATGIARSNVYRIVDVLIEKGLVHELAGNNDRPFVAAKPEALELLVVEQEVAAQTHRATLDQLAPLLNSFQHQEPDSTIKTYQGLSGFKQMLWNELQVKSEVLLFSGDDLSLATGKQWAEKYRAELIERNLTIRSIENSPARQTPLSLHEAYTQHYHVRYIASEVLSIKVEISVYDDTIAIYTSLAHDVKVGTEIINPFLAAFMRQMFEHYWSLASD